MRDNWKIFEGVREHKDSLKDVAVIIIAAVLLATAIYTLIDLLI